MKCTKCGQIKSNNNFYKDKSKKSGYCNSCKDCFNQSLLKFRKTEHYLQYRRTYNKTKKAIEYRKKFTKTEKHLAYKRAYSKTEKYRATRRISAKKRRESDPRFRLDANMCNAIRDALSGRKKGRKWQNLVGYTLKDLMIHLEKSFDNNMNWDNYGSYWHVDHIIPRSFFHYKTAEESEFKKCWALNNLQPLEKIANIKKSNHIINSQLIHI